MQAQLTLGEQRFSIQRLLNFSKRIERGPQITQPRLLGSTLRRVGPISELRGVEDRHCQTTRERPHRCTAGQLRECRAFLSERARQPKSREHLLLCNPY